MRRIIDHLKKIRSGRHRKFILNLIYFEVGSRFRRFAAKILQVLLNFYTNIYIPSCAFRVCIWPSNEELLRRRPFAVVLYNNGLM